MLEKNTETQHLATAQLSSFTPNHSPSSLVAAKASLGAAAPGTGQRRRGGQVVPKAPAAPAPHGALLPEQVLMPPARPPDGFS